MPYGKRGRFVRCYHYQTDLVCGDLVAALDQLRRRTVLWNTFVSLEREAVRRMEAVIAEYTGKPFAELTKEERQLAWRDPLVKARAQEIDLWRRQEVRTYVNQSGLYWGTSDELIRLYEQHRRGLGRYRLRFHEFDGEGSLTVRWQNGIPVAAFMAGGDNRGGIIAPPGPGAYDPTVRCGERKRQQRAILRFRVLPVGPGQRWRPAKALAASTTDGQVEDVEDAEKPEDQGQDTKESPRTGRGPDVPSVSHYGTIHEIAPGCIYLHVRMHRPLPADGIIRQVTVRREHHTGSGRWHILITVECDQLRLSEEELRSRPVVAVDVGWRRIENGTDGDQSDDSDVAFPPAVAAPDEIEGVVALPLNWRHHPLDGPRVAFARTSTGQCYEVRLPSVVLDRERHAASLQSYRQLAANTARDDLIAVLRRIAATRPGRPSGPSLSEEAKQLGLSAEGMELVRALPPNAPAWLVKEIGNLSNLRSVVRLERLYLRWRADAAMEKALPEAMAVLRSWWHTKGWHLRDWYRADRARARNIRREVYRRAAAQLVDMAGTVVLEKFNLSPILRKQKGETGVERKRNAAQRNLARIVAVGEFREALMTAARHRGAIPIAQLPAQYTTMRCPWCRTISTSERFEREARMSVFVTCDGCGRRYDQDDAACRNLLAGWEEQKNGGTARRTALSGHP